MLFVAAKLEESSLPCSATTATFAFGSGAFSPRQTFSPRQKIKILWESKPPPSLSYSQPNTTPHQTFKMPSRGNPNVPNKQRRIANRSKVQKRNAVNKITKNPRGTAKSNVLYPTSGPLAPPSGKKARKIEKAKNHARKRALEAMMEQEGEVQMTGKCALGAGLVWDDG
jgi:hypothetical protein